MLGDGKTETLGGDIRALLGAWQPIWAKKKLWFKFFFADIRMRD